jgi:hypothetical protein
VLTLFFFSFNFSDQAEETDVVDSKILPYCSINPKEKKSIGELEQEFLQALQVLFCYLLYCYMIHNNSTKQGIEQMC